MLTIKLGRVNLNDEEKHIFLVENLICIVVVVVFCVCVFFFALFHELFNKFNVYARCDCWLLTSIPSDITFALN